MKLAGAGAFALVLCAWFARMFSNQFTHERDSCRTLKQIEKQQGAYVSEKLCLDAEARGLAGGRHVNCDEAVAAALIDVESECFSQASWRTLDYFLARVVSMFEPKSWRSAIAWMSIAVVGSACCGLYFGLRERVRDAFLYRECLSDAALQRQQHVLNFNSLPGSRLAISSIENSDSE